MVGIKDDFGSFTPIKIVRNGPVLTCTYFSYGITTKFCCDSDNSKNKHPLLTFMHQHAPTSIKDTKKRIPISIHHASQELHFFNPTSKTFHQDWRTPQMSLKRHKKTPEKTEKTLVVCCILGIILPMYMGIIINHCKDPY